MSPFIFTRISLALLIGLLGLTACAEAHTPRAPQASTSPVAPSPRLAQTPAPEVSYQLVNANNRFGFQLFKQILDQADKQGNVFVSPSSVAIALSMTYNGADGTTKTAMAKALQLNKMTLEVLNQENADLINLLKNADPQVQLTIANSLWTRQTVTFNPDFLAQTKRFYDAPVNSLDFNNPDATKTINEWVSQTTQGKITQMIDRIQPDQVMFLINALYFKGKWANEFDPKQTVTQPFYLGNGQQKQHPLMTQSDRYAYYENKQFQAVSLPYGNGRMSLYVFLPKPNQKLSTFYKSLTAENWQTWMTLFSKRDGRVQLPKFKLEYEIELKQALSALGMAVAFDPNRANFANLSPMTTVISQVKHKTFVEVNEVGTEAAASTSVGISVTSAPAIPPFQMTVDRPFFCAIRDNQTGTLLFMGSIVNPQ
jgi:serine protease inhibitor